MASGGGQIGEIFILASSQQRTLPHKVDGRWIKSFGLDVPWSYRYTLPFATAWHKLVGTITEVRPWLHDDPAESTKGEALDLGAAANYVNFIRIICLAREVRLALTSPSSSPPTPCAMSRRHATVPWPQFNLVQQFARYPNPSTCSAQKC